MEVGNCVLSPPPCTKALFILHSSAAVTSCWLRSKEVDMKAHPHPLVSFRSVNRRRPSCQFSQSFRSSSIGCDILLSISLWHGREGFGGGTRVSCCRNYIIAGLAAPQSLTQLFLENISFIVSFEIMRSLSGNKSSVDD